MRYISGEQAQRRIDLYRTMMHTHLLVGEGATVVIARSGKPLRFSRWSRTPSAVRPPYCWLSWRERAVIARDVITEK